jgi:hypothetical protein
VTLSATTCTNPDCDRRTRDTYLCHHCQDRLKHLLRKVAALLPDLDITIARSDRVAPKGSERSGGDVSLPYRPHAVKVRDELVNTITTWARCLEDVYQTHAPAMPATIGWLSGSVTSIAAQEFAGDLIAEVERDVDAAERVIDLPPSVLRIECPRCGGRVPVLPSEITQCRTCRSDGTEEGWRMFGIAAWWAEQVAPEGELVPISHMPLVMVSYGHELTTRKIRQWVEEGLVRCLCTNLRGDRLISPVDVAEVAARMAARRRKVRA